MSLTHRRTSSSAPSVSSWGTPTPRLPCPPPSPPTRGTPSKEPTRAPASSGGVLVERGDHCTFAFEEPVTLKRWGGRGGVCGGDLGEYSLRGVGICLPRDPLVSGLVWQRCSIYSTGVCIPRYYHSANTRSGCIEVAEVGL